MPLHSGGPRRWFTAIALIVALGLGFGGGYYVAVLRTAQSGDQIIRQVVNKDDGTARAVDFSLFWQVWDRLHERFVDAGSLDAQKLVYGAISGMVAAAGDPYTVFLEPTDAEKFAEEVNGSFSGVGMELGMHDNAITVIAPLRDTPAMKAGVRSGDIVINVDGTSTEGWTVDEAVSHIRGQQGTKVTITVIRKGETDPIDFSIVRDVIRVPAVEWKMLDGGVAYVAISTFNGNVVDEFTTAARELQAAGAKSIIVDLRNDPGGLLDASVTIGGWMLQPQSVVVQEKFADGHIEQLKASGNAKLAGLPTVIIINGGSASASEILAGAVHDDRSVPLVGEQSFGKGSVQQLESFFNGSTLKVTIAKWLTPSGTSIADHGITPTDPVVWDTDRADKEGWVVGTPGKDPQLDRALELLTKK